MKKMNLLFFGFTKEPVHSNFHVIYIYLRIKLFGMKNLSTNRKRNQASENLKTGVYKVPHSPPLGRGSLSNTLGKNFNL